jgi:hypothetical protein
LYPRRQISPSEDSKGFWQWCITLRIPVTEVSSFTGIQLRRCLPPPSEDGNTPSFQNCVFSVSRTQDEGQGPNPQQFWELFKIMTVISGWGHCVCCQVGTIPIWLLRWRWMFLRNLGNK